MPEQPEIHRLWSYVAIAYVLYVMFVVLFFAIAEMVWQRDKETEESRTHRRTWGEQ